MKRICIALIVILTAGGLVDLHRQPERAGVDPPAASALSLLVDADYPYIRRWEVPATIAVYVPEPTNPVETEAFSVAWQALAAWAEILTPVITFVPAKTAQQAQITFAWVNNTRSYGGACKVNYAQLDRITRCHIQITRRALDLPTVYLHEIGHCLGLNHSTEIRHVMYPKTSGAVSAISPEEAYMVRRLYDLPIGTPAAQRKSLKQAVISVARSVSLYLMRRGLITTAD